MKIKKIISVIMAFCIVCGGLTSFQCGFSESAIAATNEEKYEYGDLTYIIKEDGTIEITKCSKNAIYVKIPSEIDGKPVTSIGMLAFFNLENLQTVIIPEGVETIGHESFAMSSNLATIEIPESVTYINYGAFIYTQWLKDRQAENPLVIVNNILIDGKECEGDIVVPDGVTTIGSGSFYYRNKVTSVVIPEGVTLIDEHAFASNNVLESVTIPKTVKEIRFFAFYDCPNLKDVYYSGTAEEWDKIEIVDNVYYNALNFATLHFSDSVRVPTAEYDPYVTTTFSTVSTTKSSDTKMTTTTTTAWKTTTTAMKTTTTAMTTYVNVEFPEIAGDANGDEKINMADATLIVQHCGNKDKYKLTEQGAINADVDGKKGITGTDALAVQRYIAGIIKELPEKSD